MEKYIMALDAGTTSNRCILFNNKGEARCSADREFTQIYPKPGWIEHDPGEIWSSMCSVISETLVKSGLRPVDIAAIGIANQRETAIVWDRNTGVPVYNAIVWQCRRTSDFCDELKKDKELTAYIKEHTGLLIDAYFSATKIRWILDNAEGAIERAEAGDLLFGTVDAWLLWKLTGGRVHATDYTNASRTMLFDIRKLCWDERICSALGIPMSMLPEVYPSGHVYGYAEFDGVRIPVSGMAGDQQAALYGQTCFKPGQAKNTYGTGCFLLMNTGDRLYRSETGLLSSLAAGDGSRTDYVLEGSVFVGGAVVQWIRDGLGFIGDASESENLALSVPDTGGVYLVPAFTGLGAPYWDMYARGALFGITRGTAKAHIVRAALESIAYQVSDLVKAVEKETGLPLDSLNADGGASRNDFLMQFQADILDKEVLIPQIPETTALGAAYLAGLTAGVWDSEDELSAMSRPGGHFYPRMNGQKREELLNGWHKAVNRSLNWEE